MKERVRTRQELLVEVTELRSRLEQAEARIMVTSPLIDVGRDGFGPIAEVMCITTRKEIEEVLQDSKLSKMALRSARAGFWDWNILTGELTWSEETYLLYGLDPNHFKPTYENWWQTIHPDDREMMQRDITRALEGEMELSVKFRILHPDGTIRWIESRGRTLRDDAGQPYRAIGSCLDIMAQKQAREALQDSEERYRRLVELSPDAILVHADGRYVFANPAAARLLGAAGPDKLEGKAVLDLVHPDHREQVKERMQKSLRGGTTKFREFQILSLDGRPVDVEVAGVGITYWGKPAVQIVMRDITERKQAEEKLRQSNQRLDLLAEMASQLLASDSPQKVVDSVCRKAMTFLDCDTFINFLVDEKERRLHLNACAGIPDEEARRIEWLDYGVAVCGAAARDGCLTVAEDILTTANPRTALVKSYGIQAYACHPLMAQGRVLGTLSFGTRTRTRFTPDELALMKTVADQVAIAIERQKAEEALRESEEKFRTILDNANDGILLADAETFEFTFANKTICHMLGYDLEEIHNLRISDIHPRESLAYVSEQFNNVLNKGIPDLIPELPVLRKDGSVFYAEINSTPMRLAGKRHGLGIFRDITERKQAEEAQRLSERRERARAAELQAVLDAVPAYIFLAHDPDCRCITGNFASHELLGLPPGINVSLSIAKHEQPAHIQVMKGGKEIPAHELPIQRAVAGETVRDYEFDLVVAGGDSRHLLGNAVPLLDETGQPRGAVAAFIDVTARQQAEEALHNSNERTIDILESIRAGFFALNDDLVVTYYNQAAGQLLGKSSQEVLGGNLFEAFPEAKGSIFEKNFRLALKNKRALTFETWFEVEPYKNWYEVRVNPYRDGISVYFHITTERKQAEEALQTSEARFKAIFEGAPIGIFTFNLEGRFLRANAAAVGLLGYSEQDLIGKLFLDITFPDDVPISQDLFQEIVAGKRDHSRLEKRYRRHDGSILWGDVAISLARGSAGEPLFIVAMIQDITARQEAEAKVQRYQKQLQGLAAQLAAVQETERQQLARELHDRVGQNLSVLGINLNLLQSLTHAGDKNQMQARLADAVGMVEQTVPLIRDLMDDLRPPELDDYGLLEALRSHGVKFSQRTNIAVDVVGEEPTFRLDPSVEISLFRIVQEALTNVAKHAQATRVRVIQEVDAGKVHLTIADNGSGFERTPQENAKGRRGWGLITMTERAVAAGGQCRIDSRTGKGTRVLVEVPR